MKWVAKQLYDWDCLTKPYDCVEFGHKNSNKDNWECKARQILSHPDLALIDHAKEGTSRYNDNWKPVIPLAKEVGK